MVSDWSASWLVASFTYSRLCSLKVLAKTSFFNDQSYVTIWVEVFIFVVIFKRQHFEILKAYFKIQGLKYFNLDFSITQSFSTITNKYHHFNLMAAMARQPISILVNISYQQLSRLLWADPHIPKGELDSHQADYSNEDASIPKPVKFNWPFHPTV